MNIQKAAVRASNNAMRGYIPHNAIVSKGAKIAARRTTGKIKISYQIQGGRTHEDNFYY